MMGSYHILLGVQLPVILDNRIRVNASELPDDLAWMMAEALTFDNLEKEAAKKNNTKGWKDMPDEIELFEIEGPFVSFPRGFRHDFEHGLAHYGITPVYDDRRQKEQFFRLGHPIKPRDHQPAAVEAIKKHEDMIYKGPTGSGKTITSLLAIRSLARRSIVLVNTLAVAEQWIKRSNQALGAHYPVTLIGDGKMEISPYLTIATAQTIWSRYDELESTGFFEMFGAAVLDECHHATALTYMAIVDRFTAQHRWGVSATPDKTGDFRIAKAVLGPVLHETPLKEMFEKGYLLKPTVLKINSRFGYGFRGAMGRRQSNYTKMMSELVKDPMRNIAIARQMMLLRQRKQLVLSARLEQLDRLKDMLIEEGFPEEYIFFLTGRETREQREALEAQVYDSPYCVVFSTIANEAVDIPPLDVVHLVYPQKNTGLITQQIGRIMRAMEGKLTPLVIDWTDNNVGPLSAQWTARKREVYLPLGIPIQRKQVDDLLRGATLA
jgi:superfamily II DNA or RNA helicase